MRPWPAPTIALLLVLLGLAACDSAGTRPALLDSRPPPGIAPGFLAPPGFAWGAIKPSGGPELRYGVSAPEGAGRRGQVLILPDPDEPAEVWFETARALNQAGFVVWLFEWGAFGGSGRTLAPFDMVHAANAAAGPQAVAALVAHVIAPGPERPLTIMSSGDSASIALQALQLGTPAAAVIFSAPQAGEARSLQSWERLALRVGLGRLPAPEWRPWSRAESARAAPIGSEPWRGRLTHRWRLANPDLRQGGVSLGWRAIGAETRWTGLPETPVVNRILVLTDTPEGAGPAGRCQTKTGCRLVVQSDLGPSPHLAKAPVREPWMLEILAFLGGRSPETIPDMVDNTPSDATPIE
jgi:lysophospholipase